MAAPEHLFLYGTLRPDAPASRFDLLADRAERVGPATVRGALADLGAYPGLVLDGGGRVRGELVRVLDATLFADLDRYEGCAPDDPDPLPYERVAVTVELEGGGVLEATAYAWRGAVERVVASGDWLAR